MISPDNLLSLSLCKAPRYTLPKELVPHISGIRIWGKDGVPILIGEVQVRSRFSDSDRLVGPWLLFFQTNELLL